MNSNDKIELQQTIPIQWNVKVSSNKTEIPRKNIDPSTEVAETHLLLEDNSFPSSSIIPNDNSFIRTNTNLTSMDQSTRRAVTFDDNLISHRPIHAPNLNFRLSNDQREKEIATIPYLQNTVTNSDQTNITTQDLNDLIELQQTIPIQSNVKVSSNKTEIPRKNIDPSTEVAETHLLLEDNLFPSSINYTLRQ
ncbi:unnamed protein product [Adineta steineri]|uniref:Uncharacterized protein n=1 Tax=Adineta steineri TaxID=433720 RepID=A0A814UQF1_9BILA|nr:unnamed protein product [Adineta steineri]